MKTFPVFFILAALVLTGCDKTPKSDPGSGITLTGGSVKHTVYADDNTGAGQVKFETAAAWTSAITEGAATRSETRAVADWMSINPSSGNAAGDYTITITLDTNYTGADRMATITISSGGESIPITVTQKAVTEQGEIPVPEPLYNVFTVGGRTTDMVEEDSYMEWYGHDTNPDAEEMIVRLVSKDGDSACFSVTLPDGNKRLTAGIYTFYTGEEAKAPANALLGSSASFVYSETDDEVIGYFTDGNLVVAVEGSGAAAVYTIAVDCTLDGSAGKLSGIYRGKLEWRDETSGPDPDPDPDPDPVPVISVSISESEVNLIVGKSRTLDMSVFPLSATNPNVVWSSSAPHIASVDSEGKVTARSVGTTTITAMSAADASKFDTCVVTVYENRIDVYPTELDFGLQPYDAHYQPKAQMVTLTNHGMNSINLDSPLLGANNDVFIVGDESNPVLGPKETVTFWVRPKAGLGQRTYDDILYLNFPFDIPSVKIYVRYSVVAPPLISALPVMLEFDPLQEGYTRPATATVTVTNSGGLPVTLTQPAATYYTVGKLSATSLAPGARATFTVQPKEGLPAGRYGETISVPGTHDLSTSTSALFTVTAAEEPLPDTGSVIIGGVEWSTRNVGASGKFVANPWDYGGYFNFDNAQTACPAGWRTPTVDELRKRGLSEWTTLNGVNGRQYGSGDNTLFLPAAGISISGDIVLGENLEGYYWSGTPTWWLLIDGYNVYSYSLNNLKTDNRLSVRCVRQ